MSELTLAQQLSAFAVSARESGVPADVASSVAQRVLDILGICVAATPLETSRAVRRFAAAQGGTAQATAVGLPDRLPTAQAAFVNGVLAHSLDYDDTHLPSVLHPSATVVPAAIAVAEETGADGSALVAAIAVGLEVCIRVGMAGYDRSAGNSVFFEHGQHATSICGAVGGAVAAGMLYGMDAADLTHVIGVVASMASGIIEANRTGGTVKRLHCGWAAHSAVSAAQLVRAGITGPPTVLEGRFGFFQAWLHGQFDAAAITDGLGVDWAVPGIHFKPYPANHFTHAGIDAARAMSERGLAVDQIASITVGVAAQCLPTVGQPIEVKQAPATGYMAQFSGPYTVVAGLLGGGGLGLGLDDFTDELALDPQRRRLMALVDVVADQRCTEIFPEQFPAIVTVRTTDGQEFIEQVLTNRGGPHRPLSYAELTTKFADNAGRLLDPVDVAALSDAIENLSAISDISTLLQPLQRVDALPSATQSSS